MTVAWTVTNGVTMQLLWSCCDGKLLTDVLGVVEVQTRVVPYQHLLKVDACMGVRQRPRV